MVLFFQLRSLCFTTGPQFTLMIIREAKRHRAALPRMFLFRTLPFFLCLSFLSPTPLLRSTHEHMHTHILMGPKWEPCNVPPEKFPHFLLLYRILLFLLWFSVKNFISTKEIFLSRFYKLYYCSVQYCHTQNIIGSTFNEHKNNKIFWCLFPSIEISCHRGGFILLTYLHV